MKTVVLLGDSIRMNYEKTVIARLGVDYDVCAPKENCRFSGYTLNSLNRFWMKDFPKPDVIHWNNGIWDLYYVNQDMGIFTPLDEYLHYIRRVLKELRKTGAHIIWASTTPVDDGKITCCRNDEIDLYNSAAAEIMRSEGIPINDLNSVVKANLDLYLSQEDYLHLSEEGKIACAEAVVKAVKGYI